VAPAVRVATASPSLSWSPSTISRPIVAVPVNSSLNALRATATVMSAPSGLTRPRWVRTLCCSVKVCSSPMSVNRHRSVIRRCRQERQ
jgi:hypothetical protein